MISPPCCELKPEENGRKRPRCDQTSVSEFTTFDAAADLPSRRELERPSPQAPSLKNPCRARL